MAFRSGLQPAGVDNPITGQSSHGVKKKAKKREKNKK